MHSIRLSLLVYFLLLLSLSLGGVSWLVYRTSAQTLHDKEGSTRKLIESDYQSKCREARAALDRRILDQAQNLAGLARFSRPNYEPFNVLGVLSAPLHPQGTLTAQLWALEGTHPPLVWKLFELRRKEIPEILIEAPEDLVPPPGNQQALECFQTFRDDGHTIQRSESMDDFSFQLDEELMKNLKVYHEHFDVHYDDVEADGLTWRRVTMKAYVFKHRPTGIPSVWRFLFTGAKLTKGETPPRETPPKRPSRTGGSERTFFPVIFLQYASDTSLRDAKLNGFLHERDAKLAEREEDTKAALGTLQNRLLWICLTTFAAIVVGGLVLIRHGLAPLDRLSDAVSEVSEKNFDLHIDQATLPRELQPIAARLATALHQLQLAFDREKQAAADISHELRTPLAAMMTTLEVALKKSRTPAEYRELLEECRASGAHMSALVERLLALARLDAGAVALKSAPIDAVQLARQCANLVRPLAEERGLSLEVHGGAPVDVQADADKLREILTNLLHNAIQYNKPQGAIDVAVSRDNGHVRFQVKDTGIGIPREAQERIFERFFRADPSRHSDAPHAGLGLAIVKSYLDLMGGTIAVRSGAEGSTFTVDLPAGLE